MPRKSKNPVVATAAGAIAGGVETICVWPMEYIKTQLQLQRKMVSPKFTGIFSCARWTIQNTGFFSLYRGLAPVLIGSIPKAGIRFGGNGFFRERFEDSDGAISRPRILAAGMCAGALEATVAVTPVETLKTRLIDGNSGFVRGALKILHEEGIRGIYKGWGPTVVKQSSNVGLRFMAFDVYKDVLARYVHKSEEVTSLSAVEQFLGGMCAGCFSTLINNPFDMVKTRLQGLEAAEYAGMFDCFRTVLQREGVLSFWKGVGPRLGRVVPGQGVIFMSYEQITQILEKNILKSEAASA